MIQRTLSAVILITLVLAAVLFSPLIFFLLFISVFLLLALIELLHLLSHYGTQTYWLTFPLVLLLPAVWSNSPRLVLPYLLLATLTILAWSVIRTQEVARGFSSASGNLLAVYYLAVPFSIAAAYHPRSQPNLAMEKGALELILILVVIWLSDIGAYVIGRRWGQHKIACRISPGKSLEGYIAGFIFGSVSAVGMGWYFLPDFTIFKLVVIGTVLVLAGFLGDLFESLLKRGASVKDSSNLIPGHGGVLDRIDSLLFAFPAHYTVSFLVE